MGALSGPMTGGGRPIRAASRTATTATAPMASGEVLLLAAARAPEFPALDSKPLACRDGHLSLSQDPLGALSQNRLTRDQLLAGNSHRVMTRESLVEEGQQILVLVQLDLGHLIALVSIEDEADLFQYRICSQRLFSLVQFSRTELGRNHHFNRGTGLKCRSEEQATDHPPEW